MEILSTIGVDAHSQVHVAAAVDPQGRVIAERTITASVRELSEFVGWVQTLPAPRQVAVEGAKGYGRTLTQLLLAAGETVVDVPTNLTAEGRRRSRRPGKDDEGDAVVIARVALREPDLPRMDTAHLDADLQLLVGARDQLVDEQARVRNRLHALLLGLIAGHRQVTGALISQTALARARSLALKGRGHDPIRAKLALAAIRRLHAITAEVKAVEADIATALQLRPHQHLMAIPGVGPLVAAKILGETHDVRHFRSAAAFAAHAGAAPVPASSGNTHRHRLTRGGNRQLNRALFTIAMVQARWHPEARAYLAKKRGEGKTAAEARRCLKRHLAGVVYRAMLHDLEEHGEPMLVSAKSAVA
jgi:transposase